MLKKILYVHHAGGLGGAPQSLFLLLKGLKSDKYDSKLLCIEKGPVLQMFKKLSIELLLNTKIFPFHGSTVAGNWSVYVFIKNYIGGPISFFTARKVFKKLRPDIVHLNSSCLCIVALAAKSYDRNIKIVCHVREPLRKSLSGSIIKYLCYKYVDKFIAIDSFSASSMKTNNNIDIIYNPVDLTQYKYGFRSDRIRKELNLEEKIVFLFLARVSKGNGALELIEAAGRFFEMFPNFHFILSGFEENSKDNYSKKVAKEAELKANITLMKFRTDVVELIASCDIMIIPFTEPHFSRAGIEAAAMGKPCIGANIGGVRECIIHNKTGYLYNNINELNKYCIELGSNEEKRAELGKFAVEFAKTHFDADSSAEKVLKCYDNLS